MNVRLHPTPKATWVDMSVAMVGPKAILQSWQGASDPAFSELCDVIGGDYLAVGRVGKSQVLLVGDVPAGYAVLKADWHYSGSRGLGLVLCKWLGADPGTELPSSFSIEPTAALQSVTFDLSDHEELGVIDILTPPEVPRPTSHSHRGLFNGKVKASYYEIETAHGVLFGFVVLIAKPERNAARGRVRVA